MAKNRTFVGQKQTFVARKRTFVGQKQTFRHTKLGRFYIAGVGQTTGLKCFVFFMA